MATTAHFDAQRRFGGTGLKHIAARTRYRSVEVLGVDFGFHRINVLCSHRLGGGKRVNAHPPTSPGCPFKGYLAIDFGEQGKVAAQANIGAGANLGSALSHYDRTARNTLSTKPLYAKSLCIAVATVIGASTGFLMGHYG
jgi:hypothetical protein